jgi:hypothetical protein
MQPAPAKVVAPAKPTGKVYRVSYHYADNSVDRRKAADQKYLGPQRRVHYTFGSATSEELRQNVFALDPAKGALSVSPDFLAIMTENGYDKRRPGKMVIDGIVEVVGSVIA